MHGDLAAYVETSVMHKLILRLLLVAFFASRCPFAIIQTLRQRPIDLVPDSNHETKRRDPKTASHKLRTENYKIN